MITPIPGGVCREVRRTVAVDVEQAQCLEFRGHPHGDLLFDPQEASRLRVHPQLVDERVVVLDLQHDDVVVPVARVVGGGDLGHTLADAPTGQSPTEHAVARVALGIARIPVQQERLVEARVHREELGHGRRLRVVCRCGEEVRVLQRVAANEPAEARRVRELNRDLTGLCAVTEKPEVGVAVAVEVPVTCRERGHPSHLGRDERLELHPGRFAGDTAARGRGSEPWSLALVR